MTDLKKLREEKNITQKEAADRIGISLRSYVSYENDETKSVTAKYRFLLHELENINPVDEDHGLLSINKIIKECKTVFDDYEVDFCYLFGSYAKGTAKEESDVDLLISSNVTGLRFYELVERLRKILHKKIDMLDLKQLLNNEPLLKEVLKEGIKIYG